MVDERGQFGTWRRGLAALLLGAPAVVIAAAPAPAQTAPQPLPPTREEITRTDVQSQQNRALRLEVETDIERTPCALDAPEFKDIRFTLRGVEFGGLQKLPAQALAEAYSAEVGGEHPIAIICEIRDRASAILRDAGYIAAVQVPEQRMSDGVIRFDVVMAHLTQVRVRGNASGAERIIASYLNRLTEQPVFNRYEAERYLLLASDLPGYTVRLTLRPAGTGPGDVLGDVTVQRTPAYADFNVQNGGSRELGRWGGLARAQFYGLTGYADRTILAAFATSDLKEQRTIQVGHDMRLGAEGLGVGGIFTYAWAHPTIEGADIRARSLVTTLQADYPFVRTLARTVRATAGFDLVNQDVEFDGADLSRDRLRVAFARLGLDAISTEFSAGRSAAEPLWRVNSLIELRQGLDVLGATTRCDASCAVPPSRLGGDATSALVRALLYGEVRPIPRLTFALGLRGQYSSRPLLGFEQFAAGNYTVGRGYDPGSLLGDRGWGSQAEIRVGSTSPPSAHKAALEGYAFWDRVRVGDVDGRLVFGTHRLDSVGAGARVTFDRFTLDSSLAVPLTRVGALDQKPSPRLLISLTTRLWPWSYE